MNKKILTLLIAILALAMLAVSGDVSRVSRLHLLPQSGETVLKIDVSGPFHYAHETAEAKDGKPFRVVVDIFPAVHDLWRKDFNDLPKSIVSSIRTSQYATSPESITRIVCDLNSTVMYRIEKKEDAIYLYLPDKNRGDFVAWNSPQESSTELASVEPKPVKKAVTPEQTVPTKSETAAKLKVDKEPVVKPEPEAAPAVAQYDTERSGMLEREKYLQSQEDKNKSNVKPVVAQKAEPSIEKTQTDTPTAEVAIKAPEPQKQMATSEKSPASVTETASPKSEYAIVKKTAANTDNNADKDKEEPAKNVSTVSAPKAEENETESDELAANNADNNNDNKQKPTSRFRRKPTFPTKMKGTIVAEFPKRIVMKYQPGTSRDPFENLMVTTKGVDNPIEKKIPDVETSKLVGVLESSDGQKRALLEDHDGYGYILKSGDKVKKGYVGQIYPDKAFFKLFEYGWSRTVALYMSLN